MFADGKVARIMPLIASGYDGPAACVRDGRAPSRLHYAVEPATTAGDAVHRHSTADRGGVVCLLRLRGSVAGRGGPLHRRRRARRRRVCGRRLLRSPGAVHCCRLLDSSGDRAFSFRSHLRSLPRYPPLGRRPCAAGSGFLTAGRGTCRAHRRRCRCTTERSVAASRGVASSTSVGGPGADRRPDLLSIPSVRFLKSVFHRHRRGVCRCTGVRPDDLPVLI